MPMEENNSRQVEEGKGSFGSFSWQNSINFKLNICLVLAMFSILGLFTNSLKRVVLVLIFLHLTEFCLFGQFGSPGEQWETLTSELVRTKVTFQLLMAKSSRKHFEGIVKLYLKIGLIWQNDFWKWPPTLIIKKSKQVRAFKNWRSAWHLTF